LHFYRPSFAVLFVKLNKSLKTSYLIRWPFIL